ncbi:hypothetical protein [Streptomyces sp. NPDC059616]|uniref:hypothetical protein n=1 Tax=Streptomyces sp. NPDC059616 TaxID=3346886 RepID=UPI003689B6BB
MRAVPLARVEQPAVDERAHAWRENLTLVIRATQHRSQRALLGGSHPLPPVPGEERARQVGCPAGEPELDQPVGEAGLAGALREDRHAVAQGIATPYNSGVNEGRITDVKLQKRLMAGRAGVSLLRHRVV